MKTKMNIRRKNKHLKDCAAMKAVKDGTWKTPWAYPELAIANRFANKTETHRGYVGWLKVRCNDTRCPAELWVRNDEFLQGLPI